MFKRIFGVFVILLPVFLFLTTVSHASESLPLFSKKFDRSSGSPNLYTELVPVCNTGATYAMVVLNGVSGEDAISSASITFNGDEIVKENEFNQRVDRIDKSITVLPDNTLDIKLASGANGFITVEIVCTANCLGVSFTSPEPGTSINSSPTVVTGVLYNTSGETGVSVTSEGTDGSGTEPVQVYGDEFAGSVPFQLGANTLTVMATDACGLRAQDSISITGQQGDMSIRLSARPGSGTPSHESGMFDVTFDADVSGPNPVVSYSWDFDGDGFEDESGADLSEATWSYSESGLYLPELTVTDSVGNTSSTTAVVNVFTREDMQLILGAKWDGMKAELLSGDTEGALGFFVESSRPRYAKAFEKLSSKLDQVFNRTEELVVMSVEEGVAKCENFVKEDDGNTYMYPVYMVLDSDGIWRIERF